MQGRNGPRACWQPYYDVRKLLEKDPKGVRSGHDHATCGLSLLVRTVVAGAVFFAGGNFLLCRLHASRCRALLFVLAAYMNPSPFAQIGAAA